MTDAENSTESTGPEKVFVLEQIDGILIVLPQGDLSTFRYREVHIETNSIETQLRSGGTERLIIDFRAIASLGSILISSLIKFARIVADRGGKVAFCNASDEMLDILKNMNLSRIWPLYETREEALSKLAVVEEK